MDFHGVRLSAHCVWFSVQLVCMPARLAAWALVCLLYVCCRDSLTEGGTMRQMATIFHVRMTLQVRPASRTAPMDGRRAHRLTTGKSSSAAWRDAVHRTMGLTARTATATVPIHRSGNTTLPLRRSSLSMYSKFALFGYTPDLFLTEISHTLATRYTNTSGVRHQTWYDDEVSLAAKYRQCRALGARGMAMWQAESLECK